MSWLACWLDELQRFSLLSLFTAALAVLAVYLVRYGLRVLRQGGGKPPPRPSRPGLLQEDEGGSLFTWLLSLSSWRGEWQKAWVAALNKEAGLREVSECPDPRPAGVFFFFYETSVSSS